MKQHEWSERFIYTITSRSLKFYKNQAWETMFDAKFFNVPTEEDFSLLETIAEVKYSFMYGFIIL